MLSVCGLRVVVSAAYAKTLRYPSAVDDGDLEERLCDPADWRRRFVRRTDLARKLMVAVQATLSWSVNQVSSLSRITKAPAR